MEGGEPGRRNVEGFPSRHLWKLTLSPVGVPNCVFPARPARLSSQEVEGNSRGSRRPPTISKMEGNHKPASIPIEEMPGIPGVSKTEEEMARKLLEQWTELSTNMAGAVLCPTLYVLRKICLSKAVGGACDAVSPTRIGPTYLIWF